MPLKSRKAKLSINMEAVLFLLFLFSPPSQESEVTPGYCLVNLQLEAGRPAAWGGGGMPAAMGGPCCTQRRQWKANPCSKAVPAWPGLKWGHAGLHHTTLAAPSRLERSLQRNKLCLAFSRVYPQQWICEPGCSALLPSSPN